MRAIPSPQTVKNPIRNCFVLFFFFSLHSHMAAPSSPEKRALSAHDDAETGVAKRICCSSSGDRARALPPFLRLLVHDPASFLAVVPNDCLTALRPFVCRNGWVRDPAALKFSRVRVPGRGVPTQQGNFLVFPRPPICDHMLCFDRADNLIGTVGGLNEVHVYNQQGAVIRKVGTASDHAEPGPCVADTRGRLFVSEHNIGCVHVFDSDGQFQRSIGAGQIRRPRGVALSPDESILYVVAWAQHVVRAYSTESGAFLRDIGAGRLHTPSVVAVLSTGEIVVPAPRSKSLDGVREGCFHVFAADGTHLRSLCNNNIGSQCQVAVDHDNNLYTADACTYEVQVLSSADGHELGRFGGKGARTWWRNTDNGLFAGQPAGIAIDSAGNVAASDGRMVQLFKCAQRDGKK
jgi:sugar lactone lactonase YvrE